MVNLLHTFLQINDCLSLEFLLPCKYKGRRGVQALRLQITWAQWFRPSSYQSRCAVTSAFLSTIGWPRVYCGAWLHMHTVVAQGICSIWICVRECCVCFVFFEILICVYKHVKIFFRIVPTPSPVTEGYSALWECRQLMPGAVPLLMTMVYASIRLR